MKTRNIDILSIVLINLMFAVASFPQNSQYLDIGDPCKLKDGTKGVCRIDRKCPYFIELVKKHKRNDIVSCGFFKDKDQVVCCKESASNSNFQKVLCKGNIATKPNRPIRFTDNILNGQQADVAEFPHAAAIGYNKEKKDDYEFRCGGTLISESFVLTAAHCCNRRDLQPVIVRLGKTSLNDDRDNEEAQDIKVGEVIMYANYSSKLKINDIALLKLERPATLAHNVWPACLSSSEPKGFIQDLIIIGFGKVNNDDDSTSDWLLKATVNEVSLADCQEEYSKIPNTRPITKSQVCANNLKTFSDTCQGDSGGPIEYSKNNVPYVYGITSYGHGCGSRLPSIYTRVDQYLDWLSDKINS